MPVRHEVTAGRKPVLCSEACKRANREAYARRYYEANTEACKARSAHAQREHPEARRAYQQRWRAANLEKARESARLAARKRVDKQREWLRKKLAENPDYQRENHRRWKLRNLAHEQERQRLWRIAHSEQERVRQREYQQNKRATNPVPVAHKRASDKQYYERLKADPVRLERVQPKRRALNATRRARKLAAFVEVVDPSVVFARDKGVCGICRLPVARNQPWHVDHIEPLSKGGAHSYDNSQLAHARCNRSKQAKVPRGQGILFQRVG